MMDPDEVPQRVDRRKKQCMDGEMQLHPLPSMSPADAVSKVLDDNDLLPLIIIRVGFPTSLVRAALVCKRWLSVASDPAFLHRFRKLHPPHLLGFCAVESTGDLSDRDDLYDWYDFSHWESRLKFVPILPHPPELAVVMRHLEAYEKEELGIQDTGYRSSGAFISGFWNGMSTGGGISSSRLSSPLDQLLLDVNSVLSAIFIVQHSNKGVHGLLHVWSPMEANWSKAYRSNENNFFTMKIYTIQDGSWHMHTSAATQLSYADCDEEPLLVDTKIYMRRVDKGDILVLNLTDSSFFTIQLPEGVAYLRRNTMLSPADDSKVYLMHLKKLQLCIWLHNGDSWLLVDTIYLQQLCDIPSMSDAANDAADDAADDVVDYTNAIIRISQVGDNDDFVFLKIVQCALYLDIKSRALHKVYEVTEDQHLYNIRPFMMIWPPTFPMLKDGPARNAT